jgi:DNA-binding beta-propeller fold protein YncE
MNKSVRHLLLLPVLLLALLVADVLPAAEQHLLYVGRAPRDRTGFRTLTPSIEVFDIDNGHVLVKTIALDAPEGTTPVMHLRGITASAATHTLYISHYGAYKDLRPGGELSGYVLALDLETDQVLWNHSLPSSVDRGAVTPDGSTIFMPSGELAKTPFFYTIDAATGAEQPEQRIPVAPYTHNTVVTLDGARVFMTAFGGWGNKDFEPYIHIADTRTSTVIQKVGPFAAHIRPITINGAGTLVFANVNNLIGFQVGDVTSGKVLYTANAPIEKNAKSGHKADVSHGISLTADETEVWVVDQINSGVHAFDVSGLPESPPVWKQYIDTHDGNEQDAEGNYLYGEDGIVGQPGWIMSSYDGRYLYPESGEIIDVTAKKVVGNLIGANGNFVHSRFALEVDLSDGKVVRVGDQQGVGRYLGSE